MVNHALAHKYPVTWRCRNAQLYTVASEKSVIDSIVVATAYVTLSVHRVNLGDLLTTAVGTAPEAIEWGASDLEIEAREKATVVDVEACDGGSYSDRSSRIAAESIAFASSIPATPIVSFSAMNSQS